MPESFYQQTDARLRTSPDAFEILAPPKPDNVALIRDIRLSTLLLLGDRGIVSIDTARALQTINPALRYDILQDAGHGMPYDDPARVGAAILSFLRDAAVLGR